MNFVFAVDISKVNAHTSAKISMHLHTFSESTSNFIFTNREKACDMQKTSEHNKTMP